MGWLSQMMNLKNKICVKELVIICCIDFVLEFFVIDFVVEFNFRYRFCGRFFLLII